MFFNRFVARAFPLTAALIAACGDSTTPPTSVPPASFDAPHALAVTSPMTAVFDQNIFQSFSATLSYSEQFFRAGTTTPLPVHGATYVYDPVERYVVDPTATDAPAPGARFILYAWDGSVGHPIFPLQRIGYVDITPQSSSADAQSTHMIIVRDVPATTIADFVIGHEVVSGVNVFSLTGFGTDGSMHVNITVTGTYSGPAGAHRLLYTSTLAAPSIGVVATQQLISTQLTASQTGQSELTYESHKLTDESVSNTSAEVKFDGAVYARVVASTFGNPTQYLKADGTALTQREIDDLQAVLVRPAVAHFFWMNLAWP